MISHPDKPAGKGSAGFSGVMLFFCVAVVIATVAFAVGAVRFMSPGLGVQAAFFAFGLFMTARLHRKTRLYWQLVFAFMAVSSWGLINIAHKAGRPGSDSDVAWVFWSIIWFLYWTRSKQVARFFGPSQSVQDSKARTRVIGWLNGERPAEGHR